MTASDPRTIAPLIPGTFNSRDVGGIPLREGGHIASDVLLRSDALGAVTEEGLRRMTELGVNTVVDLRTGTERESAPDRVPEGTDIVTLSLLEGAVAELPTAAGSETPPAIPSLEEVYAQMLEHGAEAFAEIARRVAGVPEGQAVLVHCTAGKDRTGVGVALLLEAAGAEREAILADYTLSQSQLEGPWAEEMMRRIVALGAPDIPVLRALVTQTPREALESVLSIVDTQHGGAVGYLREGGLTTPELEALQARLRRL